LPRYLDVLSLALDAYEVAAFGKRGDAGRTRAGEGVEDGGPRRSDEADEMAHQRYRLDGGVGVTCAVGESGGALFC
jgi:hypothetical protein